MTLTRSSLATQVDKPRNVDDRSRPVWGLVYHTTGSGIVDKALKAKVDPLDYAVQYYLTPKAKEDYFPQYVLGWDGELVQVADELERCPHVGYSTAERKLYLSGAWKRTLPAALVARWCARWPGYQSPADLLPRPTIDFPNNVTVGVEMLPVRKRDKTWGLFTPEQHYKAALLGEDLAERWAWPHHWWHTPRLSGHEDLNPIKRPGWDPGALRVDPDFHWGYILQLLDARA